LPVLKSAVYSVHCTESYMSCLDTYRVYMRTLIPRLRLHVQTILSPTGNCCCIQAGILHEILHNTEDDHVNVTEYPVQGLYSKSRKLLSTMCFYVEPYHLYACVRLTLLTACSVVHPCNYMLFTCISKGYHYTAKKASCATSYVMLIESCMVGSGFFAEPYTFCPL